MPTWGIKLGTQPFGSIEDPSPIAVGDVRWFRPSEPGRTGKLHKRKARGTDQVVVTRIPYAGYILVDYK